MRLIGLILASAGWLGAAALPESGIHLAVVEGEGAIYNVRARPLATPRVRVSSEGGMPVPGAFVTFRLPDSGPAAVFSQGRIQTVSTGADGEASLPGLKLNSQLGPWTIQVAAAHRGMVARAEIRQINAAPVNAISSSGRKSRGLYWLAAAVAVGAATAASVGLAGVGSSASVRPGGVGAPAGIGASPPPLSIGIGTGTAGAP